MTSLQLLFFPEECENTTYDETKDPTGLLKPVRVSPELYEFLGMTDGRLVTGKYVLDAVINYIQAQNLTHPQKWSSEIVPDDTLVKLFNLSPDDTNIKFQYLRDYIQPHFYDHKVRLGR